jgi:hypothetical protein
MLIINKFSSFIFNYYLKDHTYCLIINALTYLIKHLRDYYKAKVLTIEYNNKITIDINGTFKLAYYF